MDASPRLLSVGLRIGGGEQCMVSLRECARGWKRLIVPAEVMLVQARTWAVGYSSVAYRG